MLARYDTTNPLIPLTLLKPLNLLITGGAGFIGSHFVLRHCEQFPKDQIVVLDLLTYAADRSFLDPVADRITFVQGDIADTELVESLVKKHAVDVIVNCAAETHVDRSIGDPHPFLRTNVMGVQSLIDVCRAHPKILLLHVSTDEVYGDLRDDDPPFDLASPLRPSSPYAASKAAGDLLLLASARTFGIRVRITRCTNNYGPHQDASKFLPVVITKALKDEKIPVYGEGKQRRDWLYVTDHTDAMEAVLAKGTDGEVYLIGAGADRSNIEVAKEVLGLLKKPESLITFVKDRAGHDWRYALDAASTKKLGWQPKIIFLEGLKRTLEWFSR